MTENKNLDELIEELKNESLEGKIVRLHKSKKGKGYVAYSNLFASSGKVILPIHSSLKDGYAQITKVIDKGNYFLAEMKNVPYDYYHDIPLEELKEVLHNMGFVEEYTTPIDDNNEFLVFAHLERGELITIETWNNYGQRTYNSVNYSIPSSAGFFSFPESSGFSYGNGSVCTFNIDFCRAEFPLHYVSKCSRADKNWRGETPSLWHYRDDREPSLVMFYNTLCRIFEFKDPIHKLFNMDVSKTLNNYKSEMTFEELKLIK